MLFKHNKSILKTICSTVIAGSVFFFCNHTSLAANEIPINDVVFPDTYFREYICEKIDSDQNGSLSQMEVESVTEIYCAEPNYEKKGKIKSLKGIENFPNLEDLYCFNNEIGYLDVSYNKHLRVLGCSKNKILELYLDQNVELENVNCSENDMIVLDIDGLKNLKFLDCGDNKLYSLHLSTNTGLTEIRCYNNPWVSLDVSKNLELKTLICSGLEIVELDLSQNQYLEELNCSRCKLTSLNLSKNPKLYFLCCENNQITTLDFTNNPLLVENMKYGELRYDTPHYCYVYDGTTYQPRHLLYDSTVHVIGAPEPKKTFPDVSNDAWYYDAVDFVSSNGYMNGKKKDTGEIIFAPNDIITRAEFATVLYNMVGNPDVVFKQYFSDVSKDNWYSIPVTWAYEFEVVHGYADSSLYGPFDPITREQLAQMLYNFSSKTWGFCSVQNMKLDRFADYFEVSDWAQQAIAWATEHGIMNGTKGDNPCLNPRQFATRAECAAMIKNYMEMVKGK